MRAHAAVDSPKLRETRKVETRHFQTTPCSIHDLPATRTPIAHGVLPFLSVHLMGMILIATGQCCFLGFQKYSGGVQSSDETGEKRRGKGGGNDLRDTCVTACVRVWKCKDHAGLRRRGTRENGAEQGGGFAKSPASGVTGGRKMSSVGDSPDRMPLQSHYSLRWHNHQAHILQAFEALLQAEMLVDVTLICAESSFKAHKVVLSACR